MKKNYLFGLDLIKVLAIVGIILFHFLDFQHGYLASAALEKGRLFEFFGNQGNTPFYSGVYSFVIILGLLGVNLFFMASGFGLYLSHKAKTLSTIEFYKKRFIKILPLYWGVLLLALGYFYVSGESISAADYITHALGIHTFFPEYRFGILGPLWFMGTIIQLYILFPFLYKFFYKRWKPLMPIVGGFVFLLSWLGFAIWVPRMIPTTHYIFEFLLGMFLADIFSRKGLPKVSLPKITLLALPVAIITMFLATFSSYISFGSFSPSVMRVSLVVMSVFAYLVLINVKVKSDFTAKAFKNMTGIVFAVYLLHQPFLIVFVPQLIDVGFFKAILFLLPCLYIMGCIVTKLESVFMNLLIRFFPRQSR